MRYLSFLLVTLTILLSCAQAEIFNQAGDYTNVPGLPNDTIKKQQTNSRKINKDEAWIIFRKDFSSAIYAKDKKKVAQLTSKDFYDGGGGTVEEWLDAEVFLNDKSFNAFKNILNKGAKNFKGYDGHPYKATGKNKSGDLFFEYKNNQWLFGGMVGD